MIEVVREGRVAAPVEQVWRYVDDVAGLPEWFTFADRAERLSGEGAGRRQRIYGHWGKKSSEVDQLVTDHVPPTLLAWRHEAERLDGKPAPKFASSTQFRAELSADGPAATRVRLVSRQVPAHAFAGLVIRLFGRREVARQLTASLDRLSDLATSTPAARPPTAR
jgi:uncharacterized membrane protein